VAAGLSACSQVSALAPVGGDRLASVRFAANDVLVRNRIPVLVAPTCTASGAAVSCTGSTTDGATISVSSTADQQQLMTVTIGSATLYRGEIQDVIDRAARPTS
jgi:hypothetical protein